MEIGPRLFLLLLLLGLDPLLLLLLVLEQLLHLLLSLDPLLLLLMRRPPSGDNGFLSGDNSPIDRVAAGRCRE